MSFLYIPVKALTNIRELHLTMQFLHSVDLLARELAEVLVSRYPSGYCRFNLVLKARSLNVLSGCSLQFNAVQLCVTKRR